MLKTPIDHINCNIKPLGLAGKLYGLCEIVKDGNKSFPAEYSQGEYTKLHDIDYHEGIVYHRIKSSYSDSDNSEASTTGCDRMIERSYPMRCVIITKKEKRGDSQYSDETTASLIQKKINIDNNRVLRQSMNVDSIETRITGVNTNRDEVFSQEFKGIDQFMDYEYSVIAIDYTILIGADLNCFADC